jgi:hypothetical protein
VTPGSEKWQHLSPAPCRLLPAALAVVNTGGEIWMLDSANYNTSTVFITKTVSILAVPGSVGSVRAIGGAAISITVPSVVALRNLVIVPSREPAGRTESIFPGAVVRSLGNNHFADNPTSQGSLTQLPPQ